MIRRANRVGSGHDAPATGNWPSTANEKPSFANREPCLGSFRYRVKKPAKSTIYRKSRTAATGLPSGGKGHVSHKYSYKKRYRLFHVKQLPIF
jgi:hypothetical protein